MVMLQAERITLMTRLEEMTSRHKQLSSELDKYKDCDPERLKEVRKQLERFTFTMMSQISRNCRQGDYSCQGCS